MSCQGVRDAVIVNCALYNEELLIKYDEEQRLLTFDLVAHDPLVLEIVRRLQLQTEVKSRRPFEPIRYEPSEPESTEDVPPSTTGGR